MIKKIIACLTICFIITGILSPVFSHAEPIPIYTPNWDNPGIAEIINISDLTGWMANGGVYDITSFQNLDEFLTWYFKIRVPIQDEDGNITFAPTYGYETYIDSSYSSPRFIEQSNIRGMIGRSYKNKTGYGRRLQEQVDKALLEDGDLSNVLIPLLDSTEAAYFVGFNTGAIDQYEGFFKSEDTTNLPERYSYLTNLNSLYVGGYSFLSRFQNICNYPTHTSTGSDYPLRTPLIDITQKTLVNLSGNTNKFYHTPDSSLENNNNTNLELSIYQNRLTLYVTGDDTTASFTYDPNSTARYSWTQVYGSTNGWFTDNYYFRYFIYSDGTLYTSSPTANANNLTTSFTDLDTCLQYIYDHFSNIDLYVNNEPWLLNNTEVNLIPEFPDVVGGDELPTTTWPLTYPKAPSYINLPGLRQAFQRAKNTDNQFDIMDLTDSLVDPEGDPVTDPEMETVPIPLPNPDPINPEVVPELPDLPLIPPADNPGFSGVSVLAEIINFTNQSLPSGLVTVFWGIVFGAVILGIIKILHK